MGRHHRLCGLLTLAGTVFLRRQHVTPPVPRDEWRQVSADAAQSRFLPGTVLPPLRLVWRRPIPTSFGPLIAAGTQIYVVDTQTIAAVRSDDGRVLWSHTPFLQVGAPMTALPAFAFADDQGLHFSSLLLNKADGTATLQQDLPQEYSPAPLLAWDNCYALTASTSGYVTDQNRLIELDRSTGRQIWSRTFHVGYWTDDSPDGCFKIIQLGWVPGPHPWLYAQGGHELISLGEGLLGRITGLRYIWSDKDRAVAGEGCLFLSSYPRIYCLDVRLKECWHLDVPYHPAGYGSIGYPLLSTPQMLVLCNWQYLYGIRPTTGKLVWKIRFSPWTDGQFLGPAMEYTPPIVTGSVIYALAARYAGGPLDTIAAFDLETGHPLWSQRIGHQLRSLIAHRGALYVGDQTPGPSALQYDLLKLVPIDGKQH